MPNSYKVLTLLITINLLFSQSLRKVTKFMDGSKAQDKVRFPPVNPTFENCEKLDVEIAEVTNSADEFKREDADCFYFDKSIAIDYPNSLSVLSLGAKTATALLHSQKYLRNLDVNICACHTNNEQSIQAMTMKEVLRIRALINGGFKVQPEDLSPPSDCAEFARGIMYREPRRIAINTLLLRRIEEAASGDLSAMGKKEKLRRLAALVCLIFFHEAGGHIVHTMVKYDYFFTDTWDPVNLTSPSRALLGRKWPDFGSLMEVTYFGAVPQIETQVDVHGAPRYFDIQQFSATFPELACVVRFNVRSSDFVPSTYDIGGTGLFCAELEDIRKVGINFKQALDSRTVAEGADHNSTLPGSAKRPRASAAAVPGPDDYDGDILVKMGLSYTPSLNLDAIFARCEEAYINSSGAPQQYQGLLHGIEGNSVGSKRR